ncbi:M3 family metallopeptidase [Cumulibacter manganitolerans]|uniref:M3 family metallopeptidase n=1 Tax=Cumulibacter manganitolerans TaxID=1884992 RepID=UPI001294F09E|nr:M3 family metallopeptidase [Cumulibacter manganitolerans]
MTLQLPPNETAHSWIAEQGTAALAAGREIVQRIKADPTAGALDVLDRWNELAIAVGEVSAIAGSFSELHPSEAARDAADLVSQDIAKLYTEIGLDRELYDVFAGLSEDGLDEQALRLLQKVRQDFTRSGVDKDDATRARITEINERMVVLSQDFGKHLRDDVRGIDVAPASLQGLPQDWIDAHPASDAGTVHITTDYPDMIPFSTFSTDAAARRALRLEFLNRGWPANDAILQELFALRREYATLLGYDSWADYNAETKMIGDGAAIAAFIDKIAAAAEESGLRDREVVLRRLQQDRPEATTIDAADLGYYAELVRKEQLDVDAQKVRTYFDFTKVRAGLLDVTGKLFGLRYEPVDAGLWHEDVTSYDVYLIDGGEHLGRIHLDLHPREGKFKHAAQFSLVNGIAGRQLPEGVLACNFSRGLMEHSDVVTLFHEFGHLVHHIVAGRQRWARFSGVATEWDFVEAPSQMLEEWAWDADILQTFATDAAGEPIPRELVDAMRKADDFGKGYQARTQMFYAAVSYWFHTRQYDDLTARLVELQAQYSLFPYIDGTHFHASFGHLDGYSSGYYTYMWSLVIAKDMFSAFDRDDLYARDAATRYRDRVLAPGGTKDAADLVEDFLGRPYSFDAFAAWLAE